MNSRPESPARNRPCILLADADPVILREVLSGLGDEFLVHAAADGRTAIDMARAEPAIEIVLLDEHLADTSAGDVYSALQADNVTRHLPVVFLLSDSNLPVDPAAPAGSVDSLRKPFTAAEARLRIRVLLALKDHRERMETLITRRTADLEDTRRDIVYRLAAAAELRDPEAGMHLKRLSRYCALLGRACGLDADRCDQLAVASMLHDIGNLAISNDVLLKPGPLDAGEREAVERHTTVGAEILANPDSEFLTLAQRLVLTHHENWDGTGYPAGLSGKKIPLEGRICSLCDVFDALTSRRPYRPAGTVREAVDHLEFERGKRLDPDLVTLFINHLDEIREILVSFQNGRS